MASIAEELLFELECSPMEVGLVPAPEPAHSGHMIRQVFSRPPEWYLRLAASFGYSRRRQGRFKRSQFVRALNRLRAHDFRDFSYTRVALDAVHERLHETRDRAKEVPVGEG